MHKSIKQNSILYICFQGLNIGNGGLSLGKKRNVTFNILRARRAPANVHAHSPWLP